MKAHTKAQQLWFLSPHRVEVREQELPALQPDQVLVEALCSAISPGTELLVYRGQLPDTMALDEGISAFAGQSVSYPLQYGYASVGRVVEIGAEVDSNWRGRTVFSFQAHASHYVAEPESLIPLPHGIAPEAAVFLANMETAVNLLQDASPRIGERAVVIGQGIVGLLTSQLLAEFPLAGLFALDGVETRREYARRAGVTGSFDPLSDTDLAELNKRLQLEHDGGGADLVLEVSGSPQALNLAIDLCGYAGRIVVGSWYGTKRAEVNLGERFHRNRIQLLSSQVSSIAPELSGRWDKARRFDVAWELIEKCSPQRFITHRLPLESAAKAYALLDESPHEALQVVFDYQA